MEEILLHTDNIETATAEIESVGGHVTLSFEDKLLVAKVPREFVEKKNSFASATAHISESASPEIMTYVQAYWRARAKRTQPPPPVQRWDEKGAPMVLPREYFNIDERYPRANTMTGKIAVALVVISGPGALEITQSEKDHVVSEVTSGLKFWTDEAGRDYYKLSFKLFAMHPTITAPDTGDPNVYADTFLDQDGYSTGLAGADDMADYFKKVGGADAAFIAFITKYSQGHFAFAIRGRGPIYMNYWNGSWGPNQIDRVFAHETGHVFHAHDEYTNCNCEKWIGYGICQTRNYNCITCSRPTPSEPRVPCIMDRNVFSVCRFTRSQIGWCDG